MNDFVLKDEFAPQHVEVVHSSTEYAGEIFTIRDDKLKFSSGDIANRQYMQHDDAVAIVPVRQGNNGYEVLLIRQYRHAPQYLFWEIPAGLRDIAGEDPLLTAQRELLEETDLRCDNWTKLVSFFASPGCSDENLDIYLALNPTLETVSTFERVAEEREIVTHWFPLETIYSAILRGDLRSPSLVLGILAFRSTFEKK